MYISVQTTGQSAIFLAAKLGHLRVVRFLLAYGAHCNLMDWVRLTSIHALSMTISLLLWYDTYSQELLLLMLLCKKVIQV